ncbi:galactokinase [Fervidibacillus halotolerans]|uniref:Galactokinase n=1 Tax=Fervidibacillus halotolerans TaxID=2980027 RepID=A0A9E8M022_9BACI|nr:galactokinase [Fervidibacillus halotolerans]WAA12532.1 galactokinase [Fervidibacillus halotolerans]
MDVKKLIPLFHKIFSISDNPRFFFAPGRINLIGEHTDYNGGYVFPCAITFGTYALARKREDRTIRMYSENFPGEEVITFSLDDLEYNNEHRWANYPKGMIRFLKNAGYSIEFGMDVFFYGNIPNGAGLSSSASIEMVTGVMLEKLFGLSIDRVELVKIGQRVENEFIGVNSGIMDQFAVGMGKRDHGILLDCDTLVYEYVPITLENYEILIMNTNKRRELADSKYNERRNECERALKELQKYVEIQSLGELKNEEFEKLQIYLSDDKIRKRARHAISENERTIRAKEALNNNDLKSFGQLMNESHRSLRDDYEVTGKELDTIVEAAWQQEGVLGARMTGAGFGGCAIALVEKSKIEKIIENIGKIYRKKIGYDATFYSVAIGDGAKEIVEDDIKC